ncbi:DEAD-box ATP-dependent RNA helicase 31, partial [Mucuna pruriens]
MPTHLLTQLRILHPFFPMKPRTLPLLSRTFFFPPSKFLRNASFKPRSFSARAHSREKLPLRHSKSLVDDEADLSDWVDELRTARFDDSSRSGQRFGRDDGEEREFRPRRTNNNNNNRVSALGKRRGSQSGNARRKFQPRSDNDDDDVDERVGGRTFKGGGVGAFLTEDEDEESEGSEEEEILSKSRTALFGQQNGLNRRTTEPTPRPASPGGSDSYLSDTRFDQCSVSPLSLKGVKDAGYEKMTIVQEATLPVILKGKDVLAKAKTGTGKTVAFLLPSIEVVAKTPPSDRDQRRPPILVLVICPTRELASQAATEATKLLKYHPMIGVQVVIGGTRLALEQKRMQANPCQILVATPGRLRDHIENTAGFATRLMGVKVLVLDEADHLLDMGFRKDIEKIIAAVPKQRQSLMFSATIPEEVRQVCHIALRRDHEFINTVQEGTEETHSQVRQTHLVAPLDKHFSLLYVLLKEHIADDVDYKVLVFCTTAMVTRLVAELLGELNLNVREIHSRKPQSYRTRVSEEFRKSKGLILVTSDVSARGVDYPDVTLVVQVGLPTDREQYIHRLGRTGRRGKEGQGILLLAPWEDFFLSTVKDLPIEKAPVPSVDPDTKKKVEKAVSHVEMKNKEAAYQAWLGYYNSNKKVGRDKYRLVELANEFSRSMGLDNPPAIPKLVLGKMGLRNIPGLRSK